ncbi:hypothetical protein [Kocuria sp. CPCC 205263]|uniref:hypothetical protein n=1 Tax=Kocuria sp. CPCC 205263 TaxID=3073555 RepID=UPI0034D46834
MSSSLFPRPTPRSVDPVHVPLLPERPDDAAPGRQDDGLGLHPAGLLQRVFTAAGEVEAAEWALDQVLDAVASGEELGIGLDVAPLDGALESARWALDRSAGALHAEIRCAARRGVPLCLLAEASATALDEVRSMLGSAAPGAGVRGLAVAG